MSETSTPWVISILSAANFVIGMGAFIVIGLLNPIATDLGLSTAQAGWIMTIYALSYAVLSPVLIALTGNIGRRRVLATGLILLMIANLMAALAPNAALLNTARILAAAGSGMFTPAAAAVAAGLSQPGRQGQALASVFFGLTLAQVIGVPAGSYIAYTFGWRSAFFIVAGLTLPCIFLIRSQIPAGLKFETVGLKDLWRVLRDPPIMLAVLFTSSFLAAIYIVYTYLSPILSQIMGFGREGITLALLVFGIGAVIGNTVGGKLADRLGSFRTLLMLAVAQAAILPCFSALPVAPAVLMILIFIWSCFGWSFMASQQVRLLRIAPQRSGVVLALNAAAIYVGAALGSALGGAVIAGYGLYALGASGGLFALLGVAHIAYSQKISG